jgi:hypothetical protein
MRPLKILLGNNTLSLLAGSETWTYTLALALQALGHQVSCFSPDLGTIAQKLMDAGIQCYSDVGKAQSRVFSYILDEETNHDYDVIIANHNHIVAYLRAQFPTKPIISTVHGIIHFMEDGRTIAPEHPALDCGVNQFVAVSEEIKDKLLNDYGLESVIIRNGFDMNRFGAIRPANQDKPKQFLINSNYCSKDDPIVLSIRDAAKMMGAKVAAIGHNFTPTADPIRAIEDSDVVFGMGRSVLEGVAGGRLGIVYGRWGIGGPIVESNIEELRKYNFSGRNAKSEFISPEDLVAMISQYYIPSVLSWGQAYIARDHNVMLAAEKYVALARELTGELIIKPEAGSNSGVDPQARPFRRASDVTTTS